VVGMRHSAFILTQNKVAKNKGQLNDLQYFVTLLETCGFLTKLGHFQPSLNALKKVDFLFVDADFVTQEQLLDPDFIISQAPLRKVIFNADTTENCLHVNALKAGFAGIFNKQDTIELIVRGLQQLKQNKRWFSRSTMAEVIEELVPGASSVRSSLPELDPILTKRELVIAEKIVEGAQNQEIGDRLHISINTVKTHIYSIFRKTSCRNRVELIRWYQERFNTQRHTLS